MEEDPVTEPDDAEKAAESRTIPTRHKSKLPRTLSYPIGAAAISKALADAPHRDELTITFWDNPVRWGAEFRRLLAGRLPYCIVRAEYRPRRRVGYASFDAEWKLLVYPVLCECRHSAESLLLESGLPAVTRWLQSSTRAGWTSRSQEIALIFNPAEGSLAAKLESGV